MFLNRPSLTVNNCFAELKRHQFTHKVTKINFLHPRKHDAKIDFCLPIGSLHVISRSVQTASIVFKCIPKHLNIFIVDLKAIFFFLVLARCHSQTRSPQVKLPEQIIELKTRERSSCRSFTIALLYFALRHRSYCTVIHSCFVSVPLFSLGCLCRRFGLSTTNIAIIISVL